MLSRWPVPGFGMGPGTGGYHQEEELVSFCLRSESCFCHSQKINAPGRGRGREGHSLDLTEGPLLHKLHFVLALEPGDGNAGVSDQQAHGGQKGSPYPHTHSSPRGLLLGSLTRLNHISPLEALETVSKDVAFRLWNRRGGLSRALTSPGVQPGSSRSSAPCRLPASQALMRTRGSAWHQACGGGR